MTAKKSVWISCTNTRRSAALRLFCFPFAGGSVAAYQPWGDLAAMHGIEICSIQLPGREERHSERPFRDIDTVTTALLPELIPWLDVPFAFFGHSMGSLVAYELARRLRAENHETPDHVFVSAHRAPHCPRSRPALHAMPDRQFCDALRMMGGTPSAVLEEPELRRLFFPTLRADLAITDNYRLAGADPLDCPITAFAGVRDPLVDMDEVMAWSASTSGGFDVEVLPAGHFFLREHARAIVARIASQLSPLISLSRLNVKCA